jgi:hypothetical protein
VISPHGAFVAFGSKTSTIVNCRGTFCRASFYIQFSFCRHNVRRPQARFVRIDRCGNFLCMVLFGSLCQCFKCFLAWQAEAARTTDEVATPEASSSKEKASPANAAPAAGGSEEGAAAEATADEEFVAPAVASAAAKEPKPRGRPKGSGTKAKPPAPPKENVTGKLIPSKAAFHEVHEKVHPWPLSLSPSPLAILAPLPRCILSPPSILPSSLVFPYSH